MDPIQVLFPYLKTTQHHIIKTIYDLSVYGNVPPIYKFGNDITSTAFWVKFL